MSTWSQEQLEEMFGDDKIDQLAFLAGCHKNKLCNTPTDGWIIPDEVLREFAKLIVQDAVKVLAAEMTRLDSISGREASAQAFETAQVLIKNYFEV